MHGVTLKAMVEHLVDRYGWDGAQRTHRRVPPRRWRIRVYRFLI